MKRVTRRRTPWLRRPQQQRLSRVAIGDPIGGLSRTIAAAVFAARRRQRIWSPAAAALGSPRILPLKSKSCIFVNDRNSRTGCCPVTRSIDLFRDLRLGATRLFYLAFFLS